MWSYIDEKRRRLHAAPCQSYWCQWLQPTKAALQLAIPKACYSHVSRYVLLLAPQRGSFKPVYKRLYEKFHCLTSADFPHASQLSSFLSDLRLPSISTKCVARPFSNWLKTVATFQTFFWLPLFPLFVFSHKCQFEALLIGQFSPLHTKYTLLLFRLWCFGNPLIIASHQFPCCRVMG